MCLQAIAITLSQKCLQLILGKKIRDPSCDRAVEGAEYGSDEEYDENTLDDDDVLHDGHEEHRSRLLQCVVEALRENRSHWNVSVREASRNGLDRLIDLM